MGLRTADIVKLIPSSLTPLLQLSPVPDSGIEVWMENLSDTNAITYKFQESDDGVTWVDRQFSTTDPTIQATVFSLAPLTAQPISLSQRKAYVRMLATAPADTQAAIKVVYQADDFQQTIIRA